MKRRAFLATSIAVIAVLTVGFHLVHGSATARLAAAADEEVQLIGAFAQLRETPGHAYGYELELWGDGPRVSALWSRARGQSADIPITFITNVRFVESTGVIQFTAMWCGESESFSGILKDRKVSGTLTTVRKGARGEVVTLVLPQATDDRMSQPRSEWKKNVDKILKARKPPC